MLNISDNSISDKLELKNFDSYKILRKSSIKRLNIILFIFFLIVTIPCFFLPWTQNINAKGKVTTRMPEQRPQSIQSVIAGRIEKWYVQEGDFVEKGDTIVFLSEVKSEYFDPNLIARTSEQLDAKNLSASSYDLKVKSLKNQYEALEEGLALKKEQVRNKIKQTRNKISMDSLDLINYQTNLQIANNQFQRIKELYDKGLKSLSEFQDKELKLQSSANKVTVQENKISNQRNELSNIKLELLAVERDYANKMAKSQSDQQSALSAKYDVVATTSKLRNKLSNYNARQAFYYITAPQSGYITKTLKKGIGENLKAGSDVVTIMPSRYDLAVETYLKPQDLPLVSIGNQVRLRFDGWPAIIISGWPESSTGVFTGEIVAMDQFIGENGFYRILVSPADEERKWPEELRVGTGTQIFILLKDVPIWYEVWRQLNGFPADFYKSDKVKKEDVKRKAPIKSIK